MVLVWLEYPPQFPSQAKRPQWFVGESNKPEKKPCLAGWPTGERETKPWAMKNCNPTIQSGGPFLPGTYRFWLVGNNLPNPNRMALLCCAVLIKTRGENRREEDFARGGGPKSNYLRSGGPTPVNASTKEEVLQAAAQQHAEASCWFPWTPVQHNRRRYFRH